MSFDQILDELSAYLKHEKEEGRGQVALNSETLAILRGGPIAKSAARAKPPAAEPKRPRPAPVTPAPKPAASATPAPDAEVRMAEIAKTLASCTNCGLCEKRTKSVAGQGSAQPDIAFIGASPGVDEDQQGLAFVDKAGELLTRMIGAMGYSREQVWVGNVVKCRPPDDRSPAASEMKTCLAHLRTQLDILRPKVIVCFGETAAKGLLGEAYDISKIRGQWQSFDGIDVMPTFHPAALLLDQSAKGAVWTDLQSVLKKLGRPVPVPTKR